MLAHFAIMKDFVIHKTVKLFGNGGQRKLLVPGVDREGEDVVEVVDDADDEGDAGEDQEKCPKHFPS